MNDSTTYSIYRIVCFVTGKCYVGQTYNIPRRRANHYYELRLGIHFNEHLQNAFNKYGEMSFYFEVLESQIDKTLIDAREIYWICHFDSFNNGYNKVNGGNSTEYDNNKKCCVWNGVEYDSVKTAAEANNMSYDAMGYRIRKGYMSDTDLKPTIPRFTVWNGIEYLTISSAAESNGVATHTMSTWISKGYKCDADLPKNKSYEWNGVWYSSLKEAAQFLGITKSTLLGRLRKGYKSDTDMHNAYVNSRTRIKCTWNNIEYDSQKEAAIANGISIAAMSNYIRKGWVCDSDLKRAINPQDRTP